MCVVIRVTSFEFTCRICTKAGHFGGYVCSEINTILFTESWQIVCQLFGLLGRFTWFVNLFSSQRSVSQHCRMTRLIKIQNTVWQDLKDFSIVMQRLKNTEARFFKTQNSGHSIKFNALRILWRVLSKEDDSEYIFRIYLTIYEIFWNWKRIKVCVLGHHLLSRVSYTGIIEKKCVVKSIPQSSIYLSNRVCVS